MSDIINNWIIERIGLIIDVKSELFVRMVQNGYLIAQLLHSLNLINDDQLAALSFVQDVDAALDLIGSYLGNIGFDLDDDTKRNVAKGSIGAATKLLYKLYIALNGKDKLHFLSKLVEKEKLRLASSKYKVQTTATVIEKSSEERPHPLSSPLQEYAHVIQWHRNKYESLLDKCAQAQERYKHYVLEHFPIRQVITSRVSQTSPKKKLDPSVQSVVESENYTYDELIEQQRKAASIKIDAPDSIKASQIVKKIQRKNKKARLEGLMKQRMEKILLDELWKDIAKKEVQTLESDVAKKMLKQSSFEKQMTTKLFEVYEQQHIMFENRQAINEEVRQQKDEELVQQVFMEAKDICRERQRYYFERDRALLLHKKIYAEKRRLKALRRFDECSLIMENVVDMALFEGEYHEKYNEAISSCVKRELTALFLTEQPIFSTVSDPVVLITEPKSEELEEIYVQGMEREDAIDDKYFEDYCSFAFPFELEEHAPDFVDKLNAIRLAMNILGHIVFRLLLTKYPKPILPPPPDIPKVDIAVCVNNVTDVTVATVLSKMLAERRVKVVQMEDAINYCLDAYKEESVTEYPETQFEAETEEALKTARDGKKKGKGSKGKKKDSRRKRKKRREIVSEEEEIPPFQSKQLQTPRVFPCEEIVLSPKAELGRLAFESLNLGEALNDKVLVKVFVEYLKSLTDISGWVLINYPQNFEQAVLLEEALTSVRAEYIACKKLNNRSASDYKIKSCECSSADITICLNELECREVAQNNPVRDKNAEFRVSKLLISPDPQIMEDDYDTYLTAYVNVVSKPCEGDEPLDKCMTTEDEEDELITFYQNQGCLYDLYYKVYDFPTVKHLGKLIVGDYSIPPKTSVQIFGDSLLYLEADFKSGSVAPARASKSASRGQKKKTKSGQSKRESKSSNDQKQKKSNSDKGSGKNKKQNKSKSDKDSSKNKKQKKSKSDKGSKKSKKQSKADVIISHADKETQMPEIEPEVEERIETPEPEPRPGELTWKYSDLYVPDFFQVALATLWENVEEIYINDFKELFFRIRLLWKGYVPYLSYVKDYLRDFIARPDDKQKYLHEFQKIYNEFDDDTRSDDEFKAELHCRIYEFREKMWELCDGRKKEAEEERQGIIAQDWVTKQTCDLTNVYVMQLQLETDRCCDTLQLLNDYYSAMITKMPSQAVVLEKSLLNILPFNDKFEFEGLPTFSAFVRKLLNLDGSFTASPFHDLLDDNFRNAVAAVKSYQKASLNVSAKMENYFLPKAKKNKVPKEAKSKGKFEKKLPKFSEPDADVKEAGLKLIDEWNSVIEGEVLRTTCRLNLIKSCASKELHEAVTCSSKILQQLKTDILDRYRSEFKSVESVCGVFGRAIEEEIKLQPELILEGDRFYIKPSVSLFNDPLPQPNPVIKEAEKENSFTMEQLNTLVDILTTVAPKGLLPERAFLYLMQDLIVQNAEDGKPPMVPSAWRRIPVGNINRFSKALFGDIEMIDWKDFIVQNLCVQFPSEDELIQTRREFREHDPDRKEFVYSYQYDTVSFWFKKYFNPMDSQDLFRLKKLKELLYKMYAIDEDTVNYTALLLTFCKDGDPIVGVAKAIELSLGKYVCWQQDIGEGFKNNARERRALEEQERVQILRETLERMEAAEEVVDDLIDRTVHQCDSCFIEEIEEDLSWNVEDIRSYLDHDDSVSDSKDEGEFGGDGILLEKFSNVEIGFECDLNPPKAYYLPYDVLITVLMAAMPWHAVGQTLEGDRSFRQKLEIAYETCRNPEFDNLVLMHEFLNSDVFRNLLKGNFKFVVKNPVEIVNELIKNV